MSLLRPKKDADALFLWVDQTLKKCFAEPAAAVLREDLRLYRTVLRCLVVFAGSIFIDLGRGPARLLRALALERNIKRSLPDIQYRALIEARRATPKVEMPPTKEDGCAAFESFSKACLIALYSASTNWRPTKEAGLKLVHRLSPHLLVWVPEIWTDAVNLRDASCRGRS